MSHSFSILFTILCETFIQSLLLLVIAAIVSIIIRKSSAANRCLIWQVCAVLLLILPVLSITLPARYITIPFVSKQLSTEIVDSKVYQSQSGLAPLSHKDEAGNAAVLTTIDPRIPAFYPTLTSPERGTATTAKSRPSWIHLPALRVSLLLTWAAVMLVLLTEAVIGHIRLRRLRLSCTVICAGPIIDTAASICDRLGIRRKVTLLQMPHIMPMAWGWFVPVIVLPAESDEWPIARLEIVLLHELAHLLRGDWPMQRFGRLLCCFYWFHPLAWICLAQMKRLGEEACDDVVLTSGVNAPEYAAQLLEVIRIMKLSVPAKRRNNPASVEMANPSQIQNRLNTILQPVRNRTGVRRPAVVLAIAVTCSLAPLAALHVSAQSAGSASTQQPTTGTSSNGGTQPLNSGASANAQRIAKSQSATSAALAAKLRQQAAVIARQQREIAMLRKQAELAKHEAQSGAARAAKMKQADDQAHRYNVDMERDQAKMAQDAAKLAQEMAQYRIGEADSRAAEIGNATAELKLRQSEVDDLTQTLNRTMTLYNHGQVSLEDVDAAKAQIDHARIELLKRKGELEAGKNAGAEVMTQKLRAELDAAMANLQVLRAQNGVGAATKSQLDAARAAAAQAKTELAKVRAELEVLRAEQQTHSSSGTGSTPK